MRKTVAFLSLAFAFPSALVFADNWGHWRGPTGNGIAVNSTPPTEWSNSKNIKWSVEVPGRGTSSPIVWDDRVYVSTAISKKAPSSSGPDAYEFDLLCYDRSSGKVIWQKTCATSQPHQETHPTNGYASASPCTDGKHVYAHFGSRGLYCFTMDGELKWARDDFGQMDILRGFGEGSSPTIEGDMIIVPWDHEGSSALFALNKLTGKTIWKEKRDEPTGWATPLIVESNGHKQIIMNGQNFARSYDLESGKELWRCTGQTKRPVASPVAANGIVYVGSGFQGAFIGAFRPDGQGDIKGTNKVLWTINHDAPDVASPLLTDSGRLYFHKGKSGQLSCIDAATGKPHYLAQRINGLDSTYGSPIAAGGHVYLTGRSGTVVVIKDADELNIVSTNPMDEILSATPAAVDNELFIRGEKHLFCIASTK